MSGFIYSLVLWSWHASLLLGCAWLLSRLSRSRPAWIRHHIWLCALVAVFILPIFSGVASRLPIPDTQGISNLASLVNLPETLTSSPVASLPEATNVPSVFVLETRSFDWTFYCRAFLFFLWITGVVGGVGKVCSEIWRFRLIRRDSRPITFGELGCMQTDFADDGKVPLALAKEISTPMLVGIFRPFILLPADINEWTNPEERKWIIEHELAHLSRRDNVVVAFQVLVGIIFFFHPLVRLALRQLSFERELACDEEVIGRGADSFLYAENILKVVDRSFVSKSASLSVAFASRKTLQGRINNIMKINGSSVSQKNGAYFVAFPALIVAALMCLLGCTQASQTSRAEREVKEYLRQVADAEISGGVDNFERLVAPEFVRIGADGEVWNREQALAVIRQAGVSNVKTIEIENEQIRIYGDTAIVTGLGIAHGQNKAGNGFVVRNLCTFVLVKRDGRWQCVSVQQTRAA